VEDLTLDNICLMVVCVIKLGFHW